MDAVCQHCKSEKAAFYIVDVINNITKRELYFCMKCAIKLNIMPHASPVSLSDILKMTGMSKQAPPSEPKCPDCGMTFTRFRKDLRAGCPKDYDIFPVEHLLEQYHGSSHHTGKVPATKKVELDHKERLNKMKTALNDAIQTEDYEEAARLRDEITKLEEKENKS